jgi:hypothetical protein
LNYKHVPWDTHHVIHILYPRICTNTYAIKIYEFIYGVITKNSTFQVTRLHDVITKKKGSHSKSRDKLDVFL